MCNKLAMKDNGIQWIGQIPEKERLEMRDKRKEDCLVKQVRARTVIARLRRSRGNPIIPPFDKRGSCETAGGF